MNNKENIDVDILIADLMIRISTVEKLLISKNIISQEEYSSELESLAKSVSEMVLKTAEKSSNLDDFIKKMEDHKSDK